MTYKNKVTKCNNKNDKNTLSKKQVKIYSLEIRSLYTNIYKYAFESSQHTFTLLVLSYTHRYSLFPYTVFYPIKLTPNSLYSLPYIPYSLHFFPTPLYILSTATLDL